MERCVRKELLDELPPQDSRALRSRGDLLRLNSWMGHPRIMAKALQEIFSRHLFFRIVELGAGDGEFLLRVARRLRGPWRGLDATLVDRVDLLTARTQAEFAEHNWRVEPAKGDVFQWLRGPKPEKVEVILANLFLHHFQEKELRTLFEEVADKAQTFIAVEPRRSRHGMFFSRLLWCIGCNSVTRHDAPLSVGAGFSGQELSALWPDHENWELTEQSAGLFSHLFIARRKRPIDSTLFQPIVRAVFNRTAANSEPAHAEPETASSPDALGKPAQERER